MGTGKILTGLLVLFFAITLCSVSFAQENRILMTTDQQYQNMAGNADFESWINWTANNTNPPDAWSKVSTPTIAKETATAKISATSLKITGDAGQGISQAVSVEKSATYTVSFYYKVNTGHTCTFSLTGDNTGAFTLTGASGLNSTTWTRKAFTVTTNASDTTLTVKMVSDAAANIFYLDGVSVTKGLATPAFARAVINDSGAQTLNGDLTINGTTNLNGDVNLGDLSTDNITLTGTLKSPNATDVSVQSTTGILKLDKASIDNEFRVFENAATPTAYTSLRHQNITTSAGNITINPAGGTTNVTGILALTGALNIAEGAIQDAKIVTADLKDSAVTSIKISDGTIANADLASGTFSNITGVGTLGSLNVSGNVGIGTTTPGSKLEAVGSGATSATSSLNIKNSGGNSMLYVRDDGRVSIGTTTPATALDVNGTVTSTGLTVSSGTVSLPAGQIDNTELANSSITVTAGTGLVNGGSVSLGGTVTVNLGTLTGLTAGADTLAVNYGSAANTAAQGNVTLTGPSAGNGLTGGGGAIAVGAGGTFTAINIGSDSTITVGADSIGVNLGNANTWTAAQTFSNSTYSALFTGGNVGIGTSSPAAPLDIVKSYTTASATDYGAIIEPTYNAATAGPTNKYTALLVKATESNLAGYGSTKLLLDLQAGSTPTSKFSVDNSGNVISGTINGQTIGATTTLAALNVTGAASADSLTIGGGYSSTGITIESDGDILIAGDITQSSGKKYMSDATIYTGDYEVGETLQVGVGADGLDADYLLIGADGAMSDAGGAVTINDAQGLTVSQGGASITGNVTLATANATVDGVNLDNAVLTSGSYSNPDWITSLGVSKISAGSNANAITLSNLTHSGGSISGVTSISTSGAITAQGSGDSSFAGKVGIGTTAPSALVDVYNKPVNASGLATAALIKPDYSLLNTAGDGYTALKVNVTDALAGATGAKNLLDLQVANTTKAKIDSTGAMTVQGLTIGSTALTSGTAGSEGAKLVGTNSAGYTHFTPTEASVQGALAGIDTALGSISGGTGSFTNLTVTGTSDLQGAISSTVGAVTVGDAFTQTGSGNQVSFAGNVNATNGLDVTGASLTAANGASITSGLNNNSGGITNAGAISGATTITASGNIQTTGTGAITSANGLTVSAGGASMTGGLNNNTGGITNAGAISGATTVVASSYLRSLSSVGLIPEYDNATPRPDGTDNFGTLSLQYANSHNYYEWTTSEPTTQDYDIVIRYRLPDGFSSFDATTPIKLWNKVSATPGATKVDVTMLDTDGTAVTLTNGSTLQNTSWTETTVTMTGGTFTAGGYVTITIKMSADQGKVADIGELTLKGNW